VVDMIWNPADIEIWLRTVARDSYMEGVNMIVADQGFLGTNRPVCDARMEYK
jgi:hypothetical protein